MESRKPNFKIHNYVFYKADGDWCEGRITSIAFEADKEIYHVFSFNTFTTLVFTSSEHLSSPTPDLRKRLKVPLSSKPPGSVHIPALLRNALIADSEWSKDNLYDQSQEVTVRSVLLQFESFVTVNSIAIDAAEALEMTNGLIRVFNFFIGRALLYSNERESLLPVSDDAVDKFGPIYLLRLVYFLQKKGRIYISDKVVEGIVLSSTIYLLDFLLLKYNEYF
ncbi:hypothetical protein PAEPH01_2169 [Pancytospora epiphaga]|nr:hypothetical protein PAEPH01_2169 [Pancytospora epiphaga]